VDVGFKRKMDAIKSNAHLDLLVVEKNGVGRAGPNTRRSENLEIRCTKQIVLIMVDLPVSSTKGLMLLYSNRICVSLNVYHK
jgi:hypothetical protein